MKHLLDVNLLIAGIVQTHSLHAQARTWLADKEIVLCPVSELGFLRVSTNKKAAIGLTMESARQVLDEFAAQRKALRIPADLHALDSHPKTSEQVTDYYLADLAAKHGLKLATFDGQLRHSAAELVS